VKVVVRDALTGAFVRAGRAAHPDGTEVPPQAWWDALQAACAGGLLDGVEALAVAGQQHGMVALDDTGEVVRPALLWNDTRSAPDADDLVTELGGPAAWAEAVGSVPVASFTVTKLRWLARAEPGNAARVHQVLLPHDWLTWCLAGRADAATTDRGDASGTGYWSPARGVYRADLLGLALGRVVGVPRVAGPAEPVGRTADGALLGPGTGDNMGAALGLGLEEGDVVVSLGTSGTAFAVVETATADPSGAVAGFADGTGRFMPLVATLNAARVMTAGASLLGVGLDRFGELAASAEPGSGGLVLLPYLDGERTPNLPDATGTLSGITRSSLTPANVARAFVEGMLCGLADAVDALVAQGVRPARILLIGGAAASAAVRAVAPGLLGLPVHLPAVGEYVADGAARQAAWTLLGGEQPPQWDAPPAQVLEADPQPTVRAAYAQVRASTHPELG
jgi:xylulokinase